MSLAKSNHKEHYAKLACAICGIGWGLFWIPLRALDQAGIVGPWATLLFYSTPLALTLPIILFRWSSLRSGGMSLHWIGISVGIALVLYSNAFLYTDVIRAILLYYMTVVWSTLLAWIWLKEGITTARTLAILFGFSGMFIILERNIGIPMPSNIGDWMGLAAGLAWAVAAVLMRKEQNTDSRDLSVVCFFWATIAAVVTVALPIPSLPEIPNLSSLLSVLPWFALIALLLIIPTMLAMAWGTPLLSPGLASLLFTTEISVGSISASILTDEPFGFREFLGVLLLTLAGLTETIATSARAYRRRI